MHQSSRSNSAVDSRHWKQWLACLFGVAGLILALAGGCSATRRYQILSIFFDGVPDPNAPVLQPGQTLDEGGKPVKLTSSIHRPYAEERCTECHTTSPQGTYRVERITSDICMKCHAPVMQEYPIMHAPVAAVACLWCHEAHESQQPALLRQKTPRLCTQCHDRNLLGPNPPEHLQRDSRCLDCHVGHGGIRRTFLRADAAPAGTATTRPASGGGT